MMKIPFAPKRPNVSVVRLSGMIAANGRGALNDRVMAPVLERAFSKGKPDAVALIINSPGGSPAQSSLIGSRIRRLADESSIPVYAFVEDVAASGGYWLATAADEIYADATSVVGSIGVISAGFGFQDLIAKYGIERRVYTAGNSKSTMDPFQPAKPQDVDRLNTILADLHETFKAQVTSRRGAKLPSDIDVFTGEFWLGARAIELGLIDGIAHAETFLKQKFGDKVRLRRFGTRQSIAQRFGLSMIQHTTQIIEERAAYARFGL